MKGPFGGFVVLPFSREHVRLIRVFGVICFFVSIFVVRDGENDELSIIGHVCTYENPRELSSATR